MSTEAASAKRWAREYETIYILRPTVDAERAEKVASRVRDVVARLEGTITKVDTWGKRKLAYTIKKHTRGIFVYVRFVGFNDLVKELERNLRLLDDVIRFQTILVQDFVDPASVAVDEAEVEFEAIEYSEEEPELTKAQQLGLEERQRAPRDEQPADEAEGEDAAPAEGEGEAASAEGEGEAASAEGEGEAAPAEGEGEAAPAAEENTEAPAEETE